MCENTGNLFKFGVKQIPNKTDFGRTKKISSSSKKTVSILKTRIVTFGKKRPIQNVKAEQKLSVYQEIQLLIQKNK